MTVVVPPAEAAPATGAHSPRTALTIAIAIGGVVLLTVAQLLRQDGVASWNTIWAEDGRRYYTEGIADGFGTVFHGYSGYFQLVPRLLVLPALPLSPRFAAPYLATAGSAVTAIVAFAVYWFTGPMIRSQVLRAVLALSVALHPLTAFELTANITNVIWPLSFLTFVALLYRPNSTRDATAAGVACFLGAASQVLTALYIPVALLMAYRDRTRERFIVVGGFGAGLALQLFHVALSGGSERGDADTQRLLPLYIVRVIGTAVFGEEGIRDVWLEFGFWTLAFLLPVVAVTVLLCLASRSPNRLPAILFLVYSVLMFVLPVGFRGTLGMPLAENDWFSGGSRFVSLSLWLFLAGLFVLVGELAAPTLRNVVIGALAVQFAVLALIGFRFENGRSGGPSWSGGVEDARATCREEPNRGVTRIQITPRAPGWFVRLPCDRLVDAP